MSFKRLKQRIALHVTLDEHHKYVGKSFHLLSVSPLVIVALIKNSSVPVHALPIPRKKDKRG